MLKHSRVAKALDTTRIGRAVSYPGIDPRIWVSLGIVTNFVVDGPEGVFADVTLLPTQQQITARVGTIYGAGGYGVYMPINVNDEVVVIVPSGHPDEGAVIVARLWSAADVPPANAVSNPTDLVFQMQAGTSLRIVTTGAGNVILDPRGTGQIYVGGETGTQPGTLGQTLSQYLTNLKTSIDTFITGIFNNHVHSGGGTGIPTTQGAATPSIPSVVTTKVQVK